MNRVNDYKNARGYMICPAKTLEFEFAQFMQILIFISLLLMLSVSPLFSQQKSPTIVFDEMVHDFGDISETNGSVSYKFDFTNTGSQPLIIQNVVASCGCTTPSWTKQPVMPGEKGFVSAAYDPANRPGNFDKYITVQSNASEPSIRLRIVGKVNAKPLSIEDEYRFEMGPVRFKTNHLSFGTIYKGKQETRVFELINTAANPVNLEIKNVPDYLQVKLSNSVLKPNETGTITVTYFTDKQPGWDFIVNQMDLYIDGQTDRMNKLIVSANLQEDFSGMSETELSEAANLELTDKNFDFGKIKQGEKVNHTFVFKNTGKSELVIRKVSASCGCTAVMASDKIIPPGKEGKISITFNSTGKTGNQNKTITLITNDPHHQREILWVKGEVLTN